MDTPAAASVLRWRDGRLDPLDYCDMTDTRVLVADSWLVEDSGVLALELHRGRFVAAIPPVVAEALDVDAFWTAALAAIPSAGAWFPRVELQDRAGSPLLVLRVRSAPARTRSVVLSTAAGPDVRRAPRVKGPDLERMSQLRVSAQRQGAGEAVILSPDGFVVEGAYSALLWWRGELLCRPPDDLARIDSVTARCVLGLATALGVDTTEDAAGPADLDGCEIWALSALHGIRIVTAWIDGPSPAEEPGRLETWRRRLGRLSRPVATLAG